MAVSVYNGDCLATLREFPENTIDTCITDPPYGLNLMGAAWDHGVPGAGYWRAVYRVLKPGAFLLAFGGTRTHHRLMVAIEEAGFELRDVMLWLHAQGWPKSLDIGKALDRQAGAARPVTGKGRSGATALWSPGGGMGDYDLTAPATPEAETWDGWGTSLKPAFEPVVVAMKPVDRTFAHNARQWGVAGLWIDGARVGDEVIRTHGIRHGRGNSLWWKDTETPAGWKGGTRVGRWPANVLTDGSDEVVSRFPSATTARFFYCAKAAQRERDLGLPDGMHNPHPTIKPLALLRYLCRLTRTPYGGVVLDPFAGSGTTGMASALERRDAVLIEIDPDFAQVARYRVGWAVEYAKS